MVVGGGVENEDVEGITWEAKQPSKTRLDANILKGLLMNLGPLDV